MGTVLPPLCNPARLQPDILSWPPEFESNLYKQIPVVENEALAILKLSTIILNVVIWQSTEQCNQW